MDTVDGKSNAPSGENQNASGAPSDVSAETLPRTQLQHHIQSQRMQLLQAHGVLACLYEVLLHAEGEDVVVYAEAAHVAANLTINTVEELDSVRIGPLLDALATIPGGQGSRNRVLYLT
jgi:hypothetical protein